MRILLVFGLFFGFSGFCGDFNYLQADSVPGIALNTAPPYEYGSAGDLKDISELLTLQKGRTAADCSRAHLEENIDLNAFFGPAYGPLTAEQVRRWGPFFDKVFGDVRKVCSMAKKHFQRKRPYVENAQLTPCIKHPPDFSFPSAHTASAEVFSRILVNLYPAKKALIESRAQQIAQDRMIGGVHRPAEVEAGRKIGDLIFEAMEKNADFQKALKGL